MIYELNDEDMELIKEANNTLKKARIDGQNFHTVGACLLTKDKRKYTGVNCDCIHGSCAEFIAVGKAISEGVHDFDTIVSVHPKGPCGLFSPCGNCRQMMMEYCPDIKVIIPKDKNTMIKIDIKDLLPYAWERLETGEDLLG